MTEYVWEDGIVQSVTRKATRDNRIYYVVTVDNEEMQCWDASIENKQGQTVRFNRRQKGDVVYMNLPKRDRQETSHPAAPPPQQESAPSNPPPQTRQPRPASGTDLRDVAVFYSYAKDIVNNCIQTGFLDFNERATRSDAIVKSVNIIADGLYVGALRLREKYHSR